MFKLLVLIFLFTQYTHAIQIFYDEIKDNIEIINFDTLESAVQNSNRISAIEFYANWCGYSQGFIPHWKQFASETRLWHKNVLRVGAIDCALDTNKKVCREQMIKIFPSFLFFNALSEVKVGYQAETIYSRSEKFMRLIILLIEQHKKRPENWPVLTSYRLSLERVFDETNNIKYAILIFETETSYLGRKLILDFSSYSNMFVMRRVTRFNSKLFSQFGVTDDLAVFIVEKLGDEEIKPPKTLEKVLSELSTDEVINEVDDSILEQEHGADQDLRYTFLKMIFMFIKYTSFTIESGAVDL